MLTTGYGRFLGNPDYLPSDVELMVGRVDLFNMPGTYAPSPWPSELEMLRNYLNKEHNWRTKSSPRRAGPWSGTGLAILTAKGSPQRLPQFEPFVGRETFCRPTSRTQRPPTRNGVPCWPRFLSVRVRVCGAVYTSMSGMGTTGTYGDVTSYDIVAQDSKAVFFMMFGSWFGEWDSRDNLMRSVLATRSMGLACSWAGRPHWYYHHMGLGEIIGYGARLTMNNSSTYRNQVNNIRAASILLDGDPSLAASVSTALEFDWQHRRCGRQRKLVPFVGQCGRLPCIFAPPVLRPVHPGQLLAG